MSQFPSPDKAAGRNPLANTAPPSDVTAAGADPCAEAKREGVIGNKRADDLKPKGGHTVFSTFPKGSDL